MAGKFLRTRSSRANLLFALFIIVMLAWISFTVIVSSGWLVYFIAVAVIVGCISLVVLLSMWVERGEK